MAVHLSRREFLHAGVAATVAATVPSMATGSFVARRATADSCLILNLIGGPSQLDTFDPKPLAPSEIRGPFQPIPTRVPGLHLTELFPKLAAVADRFSLIRSMHHTAAPIHEMGLQLMNTGRLMREGPPWPSVGAVWSVLHRDRTRGYAVGPCAEVETGMPGEKGFGPGFLANRVAPARGTFTTTDFGTCCREAVQSLERQPGQVLTINMFPTVFDAPSWDCHAERGSLNTDLGDYRETVAPLFDLVFSRLLIDLADRGLLERTLVVATGEFGRTPHTNANGGRDHWPGCWTALVAGGGVPGGQVIGASDAIAGEPADRPVTPPELVATIFQALGVSPQTTIPGPAGQAVRVCEANAVAELL